MIEIKSNCFYTRAELMEAFEAIGIDWDALRARINPRKITGAGWWGQHLIDAMNSAEELPSRQPRIPPMSLRKNDLFQDAVDYALRKNGHKKV